jgi:hypothetical protein
MPRPERSPTAAIVIPTRNRGRLACAAVTSVVDQASDRLTVIVSDNSANESDRQEVESFCRAQDPQLVSYIRPSESLTMTSHWEWALRRATEMSRATHFAFLTDRMIFKPGFLLELLEIAARYPADVLTYNYDKVEDTVVPIRLELEPWSGQLLAIDAAHFLELSARGVYSNALPRMLNTLVPRMVIDAIRRRFGSVFASVSPDVCFAYRSLALVDRILYYDKAGLIQYAIGRSQGINFHRGIAASDVVDFTTLQGGPNNFAAAPVPQFQTMTNSMFHEYGFVKAEADSAKFPVIDRRAYLGAIAWDALALQDPARKRTVRRLLKENGWTAVDTLLWLGRKVGETAVRNPGRVVGALVKPLQRRTREFTDVTEAIGWAINHPRRRSRGLAHQWQLRPKPVMDEKPGDRNTDGEALISA